jgi:protein PhnA
MSIEKELLARSESKCELCNSVEDLVVYQVPPVEKTTTDNCIIVCSVCKGQIEQPDTMEANHWRCLNESVWSTVPAVQVMAWRMLNRLKHESWPQDMLEMMYLDEEILGWAQSTGEGQSEEEIVKHIDSNGAVLQTGDTVVLIKDLDVKGASFTAKRGTAVRNIRLVADNPDQIEGKVDGQQIVILTKFVKK